MDPFLGQISLFAFYYPPQGWAQCNGQLLPINQHQAVYSLLGTMYGGDGRTNFALPDLRGRAPVHRGTASALAPQELAGATPLRSTDQAEDPPHLRAVTMNFCIALQGYYPSRF